MIRQLFRPRRPHAALMTAMDRVAADQSRTDAEREARLSRSRTEWDALVEAVGDPDVPATRTTRRQVEARGRRIAAATCVDTLLGQVDMLALPIATGTLVGAREEAAS